MKSRLLLIVTGALAAGLMAFGQDSNQTPPQGQGRGGAPYAWGDKDGDGICDFTGRPVGQGRGQMMGGRGPGGVRGYGRGMGYCPRQNPTASQPAPASPAK